jgi:hypothetical protein
MITFHYGHSATKSQQDAVDFFAIGSGATVCAAGFHALEQAILTTAFTAFALAFYGVSLISYLSYRRFRRMAIQRRLVAVRVENGRATEGRG